MIAARLIALDAQIGQSKARILRQPSPFPLVRPYIPEVVLILIDGQRFVVACESWLDCLNYVEWVMVNGFRLCQLNGDIVIFPPHRLGKLTVRRRAREQLL